MNNFPYLLMLYVSLGFFTLGLSYLLWLVLYYLSL